ncbi:MAG: glycosyltransferase family 39 protein [Chthoniobacterales bacterium]
MVRRCGPCFGGSDILSTTTQSGSWLERSETFWIVAILITVLFAARNYPFHLDDYEQAKQAFTSFEMVEQGHWLYQHTPNERIATKPPLVGWISAAIFELTRWWEIAWRLPSLAAAILLLAILARSVSAAYGSASGLLAMSAFGFNMLSPRLATLVRTDMVLALIVFLLGWRIWRKIRSDEEKWETRDRVMMFALLTASMLIKGPIVAAFLLPGMLLFHWLRRNSKISAWFGWWPWLAALAVFGLWVAGGIAWVPDFYEQVVLREFAGRFSETVHRPQPIYFYVPHLLHKFAPWSILMIALALVGWRSGSESFRERWRALPPEMAWLICWVFGGLLVMSLVPSKRVDRIFPVVPPLCLLLAAQYARASAWKQRWSTLAIAVAALGLTGYVASEIVGAVRSRENALAKFGEAVRSEATARGWRYEVIGGKEEGLLLYLRKTHFSKRDQIIARWNAGELDALVLPAEELTDYSVHLSDVARTNLEASITVNGRARRYLLLAREKRTPRSR